MKTNVTAYDFRDAFTSIRPNNFSNAGLSALYGYLTDLENSEGEEIELDIIAFCCDFTEYDTAYEAMEQYQPEDMPLEGVEGDDLTEIQEKNEVKALEWLEEKTMVITFKGGVIIQDF